MQKKESKTCPKCGDPYFGDACVSCSSNQYAHYNLDSSGKKKILITLTFVIIVVFILINM